MHTFIIAKQTSRLHQQFLENCFDTLILMGDAAERTSDYWLAKMGLTALSTVAAPYRDVWKSGRHDARKQIADAFDNLDACLNGLEPRDGNPPTGSGASFQS